MSDDLAWMAEDHWRTVRRFSYAEIPEDQREEFFADLGRRAELQIEALTLTMAGPDTEGEDPEQRRRRYAQARLDARQQVLGEMILVDEDDRHFQQPGWWRRLK
ncbi:hypothetical protein [Nocardiopsis baichengensis]|uniref:hypothetical protein n=1 Tax=Nocardiopsis baichengensis TaxID=280240 RepID=UPI00034AACA1|nr:hypothetical protein [Nocardiopsis baichengensis]